MSEPRLLSGDNPQIPKGYGEAPVQAYLDAIPGWKQAVARRIDALIMETCPDAQKAVKWNTPLYGRGDGMWFVGFHCFTKYVKVSFFRGASLDPLPPDPSKQPEVRYLNVYETVPLDEAQFVNWLRQANELPGVRM